MIVDAHLREGSGIGAMQQILSGGFVSHIYVSGDRAGVLGAAGDDGVASAPRDLAERIVHAHRDRRPRLGPRLDRQPLGAGARRGGGERGRGGVVNLRSIRLLRDAEQRTDDTQDHGDDDSAALAAKPESQRLKARREAFLAAAGEIFQEKGYAETTLDDVIARSGTRAPS